MWNNDLYKMINVIIIIIQKLHFKNKTGKKQNSVILENGMSYFRKQKIWKPGIMWMKSLFNVVFHNVDTMEAGSDYLISQNLTA